MKKILQMTLLIMSMFLCVGCGEKLPQGMPKLYPATITVTYDDGKPVDDATVVFYAENPSATGGSWVHAGNTDADGKSQLITQGKYKGMPAATYMVTITKFHYEGDTPPSTAPTSAEEMKSLKEYAKSKNKQMRYIMHDKSYLDSSTTPLRNIEIIKGKNDIHLKVGKEEKILMQPRSAMM